MYTELKIFFPRKYRDDHLRQEMPNKSWGKEEGWWGKGQGTGQTNQEANLAKPKRKGAEEKDNPKKKAKQQQQQQKMNPEEPDETKQQHNQVRSQEWREGGYFCIGFNTFELDELIVLYIQNTPPAIPAAAQQPPQQIQ